MSTHYLLISLNYIITSFVDIFKYTLLTHAKQKIR